MLKKYATSVLSCVSCAVVAICSLVFGSSAFAAVASPVEVDELIQVADLKSQILTVIMEWFVIGVSLAVSIYVVYLGWRLLRRFLGGDLNPKAF